MYFQTAEWIDRRKGLFIYHKDFFMPARFYVLFLSVDQPSGHSFNLTNSLTLWKMFQVILMQCALSPAFLLCILLNDTYSIELQTNRNRIFRITEEARTFACCSNHQSDF